MDSNTYGCHMDTNPYGNPYGFHMDTNPNGFHMGHGCKKKNCIKYT